MDAVYVVIDYVSFWNWTVLVYFQYVFLKFEQHVKNTRENWKTYLDIIDASSSCKYLEYLLSNLYENLAVSHITFYFWRIEYELFELWYKKSELGDIFLTGFIMNNLNDLFIAFQHVD